MKPFAAKSATDKFVMNNMLSSLVSSPPDRVFEAVQIIGGQFFSRIVNQSRQSVARRLGKECVDDRPQRGAASALPRLDRLVEVLHPRAVPFEKAFAFQVPKHGTHRRIGRRVNEPLAYVGNRRLAELIDDVHDLLLTGS